MSKLIDRGALRATVARLVHLAIEGEGDLCDLVSDPADVVGVPYRAVTCASCRGWANAERAGHPALCTGCQPDE